MEALPRQGGVTVPTSWVVGERHGRAGELHHRQPPDDTGRTADWLVVDRPAIVLGSAQRDGEIDVEACVASGVEVARRRSGGGAVLMVPGEMLWLDVVVPRDDPLWDDDIGRAMWWLGDVWAEALTASGVDGVEVHRGPVQHTPWSRRVCFDGVGAGEVLVHGAKAVGVSQRRTRHWLRLQSSVHQVWRGDLMGSCLSAPQPVADELRSPWCWPGDPDVLVATVQSSLRSR